MPQAWVEPLRRLSTKTAVRTIERYHKQTVDRITQLQGRQRELAIAGVLQPEGDEGARATTLDERIKRALGNSAMSHWSNTREATQLAVMARIQAVLAKLHQDGDRTAVCTGSEEERSYMERHRARARDEITRARQEMAQVLSVARHGRTYGKMPWDEAEAGT